MSRLRKDKNLPSKPAIEAEHYEVASLAAKITTLPHGGPQQAAKSANPARMGAPLAQRISRQVGRIVHVLIWLITIALAVVAGLRIFYHDASHFLIWLNAFTRYVYLPAYVCLAWATWRRRWRLALANLAIVAFHVAWVAPDFIRDRRFDRVGDEVTANTTAAPRVRIFFANLAELNTQQDAWLREIKEADPDVIILVEFSWLWRTAFAESPLMASYRYGSGVTETHYGAVNVFSRLPLKLEQQDWVAGRAIQTLEIPLGSQTLRIVGLHAPRPMKMRDYDYEGYWRRALPMLLDEMGPLVIVGDCNATQYSRVYRQLTAGQLRSAHQDRGRGYATSWPNGQVWIPPIRIDQAFLSPEVECLAIREGEGRGSDHKPLIVDVQIRANR